MNIILNPAIVSIALMVTLCLLKGNVFISIVLASLVCGLLGGGAPMDVLDVFINGMGNNNSLVLSILLFGIVVEAIDESGVGAVLAPRLHLLMGNKRWSLLFILFILAVLSESVLMLGPSFVTILVPPFIGYINKLKIDRRAIAAVIVGGLQTGYACIPFGFGLIFQRMVQRSLMENGIDVKVTLVWKSVWPFGLALILGACIAAIVYQKPREYTTAHADTLAASVSQEINGYPKISRRHWSIIAVSIVTIISQVLTSSLSLGALIGISLLLLVKVVTWKDFERICAKGIGRIGPVAFILMAAAGYSAVFREYSDIDHVLKTMTILVGNNQLLGTLAILLFGLIITIGIGSGLAAIPVISTIIVPMCTQMGFDVYETILIIVSCAGLGDGITPASSQTLFSTAALNLGGEHEHIRDTCIPVFICYVVPVVIVDIVTVQLGI